jgi:hypothetical protein
MLSTIEARMGSNFGHDARAAGFTAQLVDHLLAVVAEEVADDGLAIDRVQRAEVETLEWGRGVLAEGPLERGSAGSAVGGHTRSLFRASIEGDQGTTVWPLKIRYA